jgi:hypothetical protein
VGVSAADVLLLCALAVCSPAESRGQPAQTAPAPVPDNSWHWSGSVRARLEGWDWFTPAPQPTEASDRYAFVGGYARLAVARAFGKTQIFAEGSLPFLLGLPENATLPAPQGQLGHGASYRDANGDRFAFVFLRQAYARFTGLPGKVAIKAGRFEFLEGQEGIGQDPTIDWIKRERIAQRLIAHFAFTHVQRTTDGIELTRDSSVWHLLAAAGRPTEGVFKLDANREVTGVTFTYAGLTRATRTQDLRVFHIFYRDQRAVTKVDPRPADVRAADGQPIQMQTVGAHLVRRFGRADVLAYGAMQAGSWGQQSHFAGAYVVEAGYQPDVRWRPWFRAGVNQGSGDGNANDDRHGTFFQMLPTARIYARFPFFNMMNTEDAFAQAIVRPSPRLTFRADYHHLRLSSASDLWYGGGGVFDSASFGFSGRPSSGRRSLAWLADLQADVRPNDRTVLSAYVGYARGGDVVSRIYPAGSAGSFVFFEMARRF